MATDDWQVHATPVPIGEALTLAGPGGVDLARRLTRRLFPLRPMRWSSLRSLATRSVDTVHVEAAARALFDAGWVAIRSRRNRRGDPEPVELRLREEHVEDAAAFLGEEGPDEHARKVRLLVDALRELRDRPDRRGPLPERVLVQRVFGSTKAARLRTLRAELEPAVGVPLEVLVRFHVDTVLAAGPVAYTWRGVRTDLRGSEPWGCVTEPVVHGLEGLVVDGVDELVCVENQTPFESLLYEGLARDAVVLFTSGFLGSAHRRFLGHLVRAGIRRVRHWGDLDPFGLSIYRDLRNHVRGLDASVAVSPWRMEVADLARPDATKLVPEDWVELHRYLRLDDAPQRELAEAMRHAGRKLEQEALLET
jgi:hypothetical protein